MIAGSYRIMLECIGEKQPVRVMDVLNEMQKKGAPYNLTRNNLQTALYRGHIEIDIDMKVALCYLSKGD